MAFEWTNEKIDGLICGKPSSSDPPLGLGQLLVGLQILATDDDRDAAGSDQAKKWDWDTPISLQATTRGREIPLPAGEKSSDS